MDQIIVGVLPELLKLGLPGAFIGYLIYCCHCKDNRYDDLARMINEIQERRATERSENTKALIEGAAALSRMAISVDQATREIQDSVRVAVETVAAAARAVQEWRPRR